MEELANLNSKILTHPRVLVVEDDPMQRILWKHILQKVWEKAEVHWADSYQEASQLLQSKAGLNRHFDLMISDVFLKGEKTGFELIKDYFHALHGRVILVSDFGSVETPKLSKLVQEPLYLRKPLNANEAMAVVSKIFSHPQG